jgi:hypothetical protein
VSAEQLFYRADNGIAGEIREIKPGAEIIREIIHAETGSGD